MHREKVDVPYCSDVTAITVRLQWDVQPSFLGVSDSQECFSPFLLRAGGVLVLLRVLLHPAVHSSWCGLVWSRDFKDLCI